MNNIKKKEIWKNIINYENLYQISNYGRIKSLERIIINKYNEKRLFKEKMLSCCINENGYYRIGLQKNKLNQEYFKVSRLVAIHFINNPENKPQVNHIDGNKLNNYYENLEWVTAKENTVHAYKNNLANNYHSEKSVSLYDKNNNFIRSFKSITEASKWRNVHVTTITRYTWHHKDPLGYIWKINK